MSQDRNVILPGATLGVLGGGQLGRMFAHAAQAMGYFTAVLDKDATSQQVWSVTTTCAPATKTRKVWQNWPSCAPP